MSKTLELNVTGLQPGIKACLGKHEAELEADATEIVGEPVDVQMFPPRGGRSVVHGSSMKEALQMAVLQIRQTTEMGKAFDRLRSKATGGRQMGSLVIAEPTIFHDPDFQSQVFSQSQGSRFRVLVNDQSLEEERFFTTFRELFGSLLNEAAEEDPHDEERRHQPYLRVSQRIRNEVSGRLDAVKVAEFFGLTPTELARILQVKRQTLFKTPDSLNLQKKLYPFEEIVRGLLMVDDDPALFRQWLNTPSRDLPKKDGQHMTPMDMIREGHPTVIAGLIDSALTGHSS